MNQYRSTLPPPITWYGKDADVAPPPEEAGTFPQHGGANAPKEGNKFSILGIVYFPPLGNPDKSKG